jgi:5-methylcytosine-specific restriction enzyme A
VGQHARLYNTRAWQRKRYTQLKNSPLCAFCWGVGRAVPASVADHVIPHRGDEELFFNGELQSLCKVCHDSAKQQLERSGYLKGGDASGYPLDKNHHWADQADNKLITS